MMMPRLAGTVLVRAAAIAAAIGAGILLGVPGQASARTSNPEPIRLRHCPEVRYYCSVAVKSWATT